VKIKFRKKMLLIFWYWINERHKIFELRKEGKPFPWTKDKILQEYKFTNPFRQHDRVTQEWVKRYVTLIGTALVAKDEDLLFQVAMFRLFNWPETYDALRFGLTSRWDVEKAIKILHERQKEGKKVFTGAYIIPSGATRWRCRCARRRAGRCRLLTAGALPAG
jgi:hypothetical protein